MAHYLFDHSAETELERLIAQGLSVAGGVPSFATAVLAIAVPAGVALVLICLFGRESRGRDLRELDAAARSSGIAGWHRSRRSSWC